MKKNLIIILSLVAIVAIISVVASLLSPKKKEALPLPNAPSIVPENPSLINTQTFQLTDVSPQKNISKIFLPIQEIALTFNKPVSVESFYYLISPPTKVSPRQGESPAEIIISPNESWQEGITTIIISSKTKSTDGQSLSASYTYKLNTAFPKAQHGNSDY